MKTIYLVSCVSKKLDTPAAAKNLYVSDWFMKARRYVESLSVAWYILSAEHQLLDPEKVISPYNNTLNSMGVADRRKWGQEVLAPLLKLFSPGDKIVFLAGVRYREFLVAELTEAKAVVEVPMQGLTIGRQLRWLLEAANGK